MKIYANGCSFTYGDELVSPGTHSWPQLLGEKLNATVTNDAISGGTNQRTVYHTIKNLKFDFNLYIISWTTYSRFTFYKSDNNFEINFNPQLVNKIYSNEAFYRDWGRTLYTKWFNELYAFKLWLQQIIQLQSLLEKNNKKYIMINTFPNELDLWLADKDNFVSATKTLINFDIMNDNQIFDEYHEIQYYIKLVNFNNFYNWKKFSITDLCKQYPVGPKGHILEQGHEHLANLLYEHLCLK